MEEREYEESFIIYSLLLCCTLISWTLFDVTSEEHDFHKCQEITSDAYCRNHAVVHRLSRWCVMKGLFRSTSWHLWSLLLWNTNQSLQGPKRFIQTWVRILISSCPLVVKDTGGIMEMHTRSFSGHIRPKTRKVDSTIHQPYPPSGGHADSIFVKRSMHMFIRLQGEHIPHRIFITL